MRVERELMRGAGPFAVLKLLKRREMYGYELVEALSEHTEGVLAMGQSLEAKGYISSHWRQADSGRQRKYYALTRQGRQRLAFESRQWQALVNAIASLGVVAEPQGAAVAVEAPS
jgi:PadR family transcriptional regulator PadR